MRTLSTLALLAFFFHLSASNTDSLLQLVKGQKGQAQIDQIYRGLSVLRYEDSTSFFSYHAQVQDLVQDQQSIQEVAFFKRYAEARWRLAHDQEANAMQMLMQLEKDLEEVKYSRVAARVSLSLSSIFSDLGSIDKSLNYALKALHQLADGRDSLMLMEVYNTLGENYRLLEEYEHSLEYYASGLKVARALKDTLFQSRVKNNMGIALSQLKRFDTSEDTLKSGLALAQALDHKYSQAILLTNLGFNAKNKEAFDEALDYYERSLELKKQFGNQGSIAYTLNDIGEVYYFQKKYSESIEYSKRALQMATASNALFYVKDISKTLAKTFAAAGEHDSAYVYQLAYQNIQDKVFNENNFKEIARLERLHELQEKELENELLSAENARTTALVERQYWLLAFVIAISLGLLLIGALIWRTSKMRKRLLHQLEQKNRSLDFSNERLTNLLNEQESLFNIVTHDLKGPLINSQRLLEMQEEDVSPEESDKMRTMIKQSVNGALDFISEFNQLHELEKSSTLPPLASFNLTALISDLLEQFNSTMIGKQVTVHFNVSQNIDVMGIEVYAKHIFYNLISNAIRYSPTKGSIFITITQSDTTRVSIEDQGPGIPNEELDRIFERFYRGSSGAAHQQSNGLGLSLVKLLIDKQNGAIKVKSQPGKTEFVVYLP